MTEFVSILGRCGVKFFQTFLWFGKSSHTIWKVLSPRLALISFYQVDSRVLFINIFLFAYKFSKDLKFLKCLGRFLLFVLYLCFFFPFSLAWFLKDLGMVFEGNCNSWLYVLITIIIIIWKYNNAVVFSLADWFCLVFCWSYVRLRFQ